MHEKLTRLITFVPRLQRAPVVGFLALAMVITWAYTMESRIQRRTRGRFDAMSKREEDRKMRALIADLVTTAFEEAVEQGVLPWDVAKKYYIKIAHLGIWDLHPRRFNPRSPLTEEVREAVRFQIGKEAAKNKNGPEPSSELNELEKVLFSFE